MEEMGKKKVWQQAARERFKRDTVETTSQFPVLSAA